MRKSFPPLLSDEPPPPKRGRSSEDFLMFCKMILDYENYDDNSSDAMRYRHTSSPMGSTASMGSLGSNGESSLSSFTEDPETQSPSAAIDPDMSDEDIVTDEGEDEEITCYCKKPYGGRPMIECSSCQTWVHLTCAKVKRTAIPDVWYCSLCKTKSTKLGQAGAKSRARKALNSRRKKPLNSSTSLTAISTSSSSSATGTLFKSSSKRKL